MKISAHFKRQEFACKCGCGFDTVDAELLKILESERNYWGKPITINSGARCKDYNAKVDGKKHSQHLLGRAADFTVKGVEPTDVANRLNSIYPDKFGIGWYKGFTHIDTRNGAGRWDSRNQ